MLLNRQIYYYIKQTILQLGGLVLKTLACCARGPGFYTLGGEPKIFQGPSSAKSQLDVIWMGR